MTTTFINMAASHFLRFEMLVWEQCQHGVSAPLFATCVRRGLVFTLRDLPTFCGVGEK